VRRASSFKIRNAETTNCGEAMNTYHQPRQRPLPMTPIRLALSPKRSLLAHPLQAHGCCLLPERPHCARGGRRTVASRSAERVPRVGRTRVRARRGASLTSFYENSRTFLSNFNAHHAPAVRRPAPDRSSEPLPPRGAGSASDQLNFAPCAIQRFTISRWVGIPASSTSGSIAFVTGS
jgi:hypothetical protein